MMTPTSTHDPNEEELRTLFNFLGGEQNGKSDNLKAYDIKFGLENYGLPLSEEVVKSMKLAIDKKARNDLISFQDFKSLWEASAAPSSNSNVAKYMYHLLFECIKTSTQDKGGLKLDSKNLLKVLCVFGIIDESDEKKDGIAKEMIKCLASNGEYVVLKDFERLIDHFMQTKII